MREKNNHRPVLVKPFINFLKTLDNFQYFLDGTFGRGGHTKCVLSEFSKVKIEALDWDEEAICYGKETFPSVNFVKTEFSAFTNEKKRNYDAILLDLGVSSPQLDQPHRGFSFYNEGPLDMRMSQGLSITAADIINQWSEKELIQLFQNIGYVQSPYKVVSQIVHERKKNLFTTTTQLSQLIERVVGWRKKHSHPATLYFLALRIEVNRELEHLEKALPHLVSFLSSGGIFIVISFHSLEDRLVKYFFKEIEKENQGVVVTKKVVKSTWEESKDNRRARSAKMRVFRKK